MIKFIDGIFSFIISHVAQVSEGSGINSMKIIYKAQGGFGIIGVVSRIKIILNHIRKHNSLPCLGSVASPGVIVVGKKRALGISLIQIRLQIIRVTVLK